MFGAIVMQVKAFVVLLLEALGISTVLAAFSLEFIMLHDILVFGNFHAIENNLLTLTVELSLAACKTLGKQMRAKTYERTTKQVEEA
jgi:hypothetical protein